MKTAFPLFCALLLALPTASAQDASGWDSPDAIQIGQTNARIDVKDRVEISADVPGKIMVLNAQSRGDTVTKGEVIVELRSEFVRSQLKEAEAKAESNVLIEYARASLDAASNKLLSKIERNNRSMKQTGVKVISDDEIKQLKLEEIKAQAELAKSMEDQKFAELARDTKKVELDQYVITAEIGGIVTDTHKRAVGSAVRQGDPILTVVNLEEVFAVLTVSPRHENRINIGDKVLVRRLFVESPGVDNGSSGGGLLPRQPGAGEVRQTSLPAAVPNQAEQKTFVGEVTYIGSSQANKLNLIEIEAVVKNELAGPGKYWLREGANIEAVIIPAK